MTFTTESLGFWESYVVVYDNIKLANRNLHESMNKALL